MKLKTRFISSVVKTAAKSQVVMPWTRGTRRQDFIEARKAETTRKTA